ncbi:MAG: carboxypeptidase regulatory-like domain-containing protein [Bacteroidota bacterium]
MKTNSFFAFFAIPFLFFFHFHGNEADPTIRGIVQSTDGEPLVGASIEISVQDTVILTDYEGAFEIDRPKTRIQLLVSYVGFVSKKVDVTGTEKQLLIQLKKNTVRYADETADGTSGDRPKTTDEAIARDGFIVEPVYDPETYEETYTIVRSEETPLTAAPEERVKRSTEDAFLRGMTTTAAPAPPATRAGMLTAGEVNDFMKWDLWQDVSEEDLRTHQEAWQLVPKDRYTVQLQTKKGSPLVDCKVQLLSKTGRVLWESRTDNTGKAELWANLFYGQQDEVGRIVSDCDGVVKKIKKPKKFQEGINIQEMRVDCNLPQAVDIVFAVDATGSMQDEINYLKAELNDVITRIKDTLPTIDLRLGSVFYRDHSDAYLTRQSPLSSDISKTTTFIENQNAGGGGDYPEAVEDALQVAINDMEWSPNAITRIIFLVLDAPPHNNPEVQKHLRQLATKAAQQGIRIVPVACSGTNKPMEYLMRSLSLATNGSYIFLTDDSGIGAPHIEPTTDDYKVEKLNGLLQRVIYQFAFTPECEEPLFYPIDLLADTAVAKTAVQTIHWKYYPNPTSGQLTVEIDGDLEYLYLTDLSGKVLQQFRTNGLDRLELNLGNYPDGIYQLRYEYQQGRWLSGKVVLARA